jgi:mercuric transport protein
VGQGTGEKDSDVPASFQQVVLDVEGMTCQACPKTVSTALKDVDGVYSVDATYEPPEAVVRFDPAATSVDRLTTATENVGFSAHPQSDS